MRTTISIEDGILEKAKETALKRKCSLGNVIEESLRKTLIAENKTKIKETTVLPQGKGGGLRPGVNLNSNSDLLDIMEGL